jgi:hypothetical protein
LSERELFTAIARRSREHDSEGGFEEAKKGEGPCIAPGFEGEFKMQQTLTKPPEIRG